MNKAIEMITKNTIAGNEMQKLNLEQLKILQEKSDIITRGYQMISMSLVVLAGECEKATASF